jgi:Domain of unknown function (DUF4394)/IPTL-CTERM motif
LKHHSPVHLRGKTSFNSQHNLESQATMTIRSLKSLAIALSVGLFSLNAAAALYGTTGAGGSISTFVEINPDTGALVSTIGSVGYAVNGMTYDPTTGTLYASTSGSDVNCPRGLITINPATGAGTVVGCGSTTGESPALLTSDSAGNLFSWLEPVSDDLITWNKTTGSYSASIGNAGLSTSQHTLAFDNSNVLYLLNYDGQLYTINTATGASTLVGPVTDPSTTKSYHHGDFNPANNQLYVIDRTANGNNPRNIKVVDVATPSVVATLPTVDDLHVLVFAVPAAPAAVQAVPTLSQWAMLITALVLGLFGFLSMRRRAS